MMQKRLKWPSKEQLHLRMQLQPKDEKLLRMLFSSSAALEEKADLFTDLDIEQEPMEFNLMLAHFCHRQGNRGIPPEIIPRMRGVARFYLFKNAALFSSFGPLQKLFKQAEIPVLLLKGSAIKACYDQETSRCLSDIDFAVPKERLKDAVRISENHGFNAFGDALHSIDMKQSEVKGGVGQIDIHHCLFKTSLSRTIEEELAEGARKIKFFDSEAWIPSPENLVLHILENEFHNLCTIRNNRRHFKWMYDIGLILSSTLEFNWNHLTLTAKKYFIYDAIQPMIYILSDYLPQLVKKDILIHHFPFQPIEFPYEHFEHIKKMEKIVTANFDWCLQGIHREELQSSGKKWKALFLWPSQMAAKFRMFRYQGKLNNCWEFILLHCQAKNFFEVLIWLFVKLQKGLLVNKKEVRIND